MPIPEDSTLYDLVQMGIKSTHAAVSVVVRLRKELSLVKDVPVLIAIDQVSPPTFPFMISAIILKPMPLFTYLTAACLLVFQYNNWFTFSEFEEPVTPRSCRPIHARELTTVSFSSEILSELRQTNKKIPNSHNSFGR